MNWIANTMENYFTFKGRAQRKEYWYLILLTFIGQTVLTIADIALIYFVGVSAFPNILFFLVTLIPSITVCVRRLHDTGRSGSAMILFFIPIIGFFIWLYFCAQDSQPGDNKYGPNPKGGRS